MVRRGLIITYYFPPLGGGGVQRWAKLIKYLSRLNWQFTVITRAPFPNEIEDHTFTHDLPQNLKVITTNDSNKKQHHKIYTSNSNYWKRWLSSLIFITDSRKNWIKSAWRKVKEELHQNKYDVIVCSIPPYSISFLAVQIKKKFKDTPVLLDLRDPWSINPYKIYPTPLHRFWDKHIELKNISNIDYLISAYQSVFDYYQSKVNNFNQKKTLLLSNGYDEEDFSNLTMSKDSEKADFKIAFSGTFYSHMNRPDILFKAIAKLIKKGYDINFHHIGSSVYNVKELAAQCGIENHVVLWGYKNHQECLSILNRMDAFAVILDAKAENADKTIGGKVYEYLRLKKPILGLVPKDGEAAKLINETNSGIVCEKDEAEQIAESILNLKSGEFSFNNIEQFDRQNLAKKLHNFLSQITGQVNNE